MLDPVSMNSHVMTSILQQQRSLCGGLWHRSHHYSRALASLSYGQVCLCVAAADRILCVGPHLLLLGPQDRISTSGELITVQQRLAQQEAASRSIESSATAPAVPPLTESQLEQLAEFVHGSRRLLVLTGKLAVK